MKILHLLMSNKFSGAENVVCQIIESCREYKMAYCSPKGQIGEELAKREVQYIPLDNKKIKSIRKAVLEFNPDIIHAHDYRASVLASHIGFKGILISHLHNNNPSIRRWGLKSLVYNSTIDKYDKVVLVSNAIYEEAVFRKKLSEKYYILDNYLSKEDVIKKASEENTIKSDVIFVGRLEEPKNPLAFIDIINGLKEKIPDIKAVMVGDGKLKEECVNKIVELKLIHNIQMLGFRSNPYKIMKDSKIVLMPSKWDGLPMVALESMILNKIVIARKVGGLKEIFRDNEDFLFENNEDVVEKIFEILNNEFIMKKKQSEVSTIIDKYINKDKWKYSLNEIYRK